MIRLPGIRDKGSGPQLGAHPGEQGPFGWYGADEDQADEDDGAGQAAILPLGTTCGRAADQETNLSLDDGQDDEQHDH